MKGFISIFKAEHYKTKGNMAVLLFLLCPFVAITGVYIDLVIDVIKAEIVEISVNPWILLFRNSQILYLFYPLLVSILAYSLCDMEYRNRNFKRLFTLPYTVPTLFSAKMVFLAEIVLISVLIAYTTYMAGGFILSYLLPALTFQDYDIRLACLWLYIRLFISLLAVSFIQHSLSLVFKNFVIPVGFGCFITLFSLLTINKEWSYLNPYAAVFNAWTEFMSYQSVSFRKYDYVCLVYILIFMLINYFLFKRQKIH